MSGAASSPLVSTSLTRPTMISWSPPSSWCSTVHSRVAITPSRRGLPVRPRRCRTPSQRAASTLTANAPWARTDCSVRLDRSKQTRISGGSRESELTALAVVPTGWPSGSTEVTTVTPVAKWPIACRKSAPDTSPPSSLGSVTVISELSVVRGEGVVEQVIADMVILPIDGVVASVRPGVPPVSGQVVTLIGGARPGQREQIAGHLDSGVAGERLSLGDGNRAARRFLGVAGEAGPLGQRGRRRGEQRLGRRHLGGEPAEAVDRVRVGRGRVRPAGPGGLEERARLGRDERAGVAQRAARDPHLDRGVHQLGPGPELLRHLERVGVGDDQAGLDRHLLEGRGAADGGALAHYVPVLVDADAGGVPVDEGEHHPVIVVERGDPDPAG